MRPLDRLRLLRGVTKNCRRAALGFASAASMACLAGAAYPDAVPPASWPATLAADEFMETSVGVGTVPAGAWGPLDAFPLLAPSFRAEATPGTGAAPAAWFGFLGANWQSPNLLGDMGGLRPALAKYGVTLSILENVETFGNLTGGVRQGFEVERPHHGDAAVGHPESVRAERRDIQHQRPTNMGRQSDRGQSPDPADPDRHRGARRHSTLGTVVSTEIRRQVRH